MVNADLKTLVAKIWRSLQRRGFRGTVRHTLLFLKNLTLDEVRWIRARATVTNAGVREFDVPGLIETAGLDDIDELTVDSENLAHGSRYEAVVPIEFHSMMQAAGDVCQGRVFLDLGCGKGRAILLASEYPFNGIIGVEFAAELAEIASRNVRNYSNTRQLCKQIEVVHEDAAEYAIPDTPLVIFLFNPFRQPVMGRVVDNVRRSLDRYPRPLTVIYNQPVLDDLWSALPQISRVVTMRRESGRLGYSIYQSIPQL